MVHKLKKSKFNLKAVTLVESIVYLALFGAIFLVIIQFAVTIGSSNDKSIANNELQRSLIFINEHINDTFTESSSVDKDNSVFNSTEGRLRFNTTSGYMEYTIEQGDLIFDNNGVQTNTISNPEYNITNFYIEPVFAKDGSVTGVKLTTNISASKSGVDREFHSSYLLD